MPKSPSPACPISFMQWSPKISQMKNCCQKIEGTRRRAGAACCRSWSLLWLSCQDSLVTAAVFQSVGTELRAQLGTAKWILQSNTAEKARWMTSFQTCSLSQAAHRGESTHSCSLSKYIALPNSTQHLHPNLLMERNRKYGELSFSWSLISSLLKACQWL